MGCDRKSTGSTFAILNKGKWLSIPVPREHFTITTNASPKQIEDIIKSSGIKGISVDGERLMAYDDGDAGSRQSLQRFVTAFERLEGTRITGTGEGGLAPRLVTSEIEGGRIALHRYAEKTDLTRGIVSYDHSSLRLPEEVGIHRLRSQLALLIPN